MTARLAPALAGLMLLGACTVYSTAPAQEPSHQPPPPAAGPGAPPPPAEQYPEGEPMEEMPAYAGLQQHPPVQCVGNQDIALEGVFIDTPDNAIEIMGNCDVHVVGSHIRAGQVAIFIQGNGDVHVSDSVIEGSQAAFVIQGNGTVHATESRFFGAREIVGNGDFDDQGGNVWQ